MLEKNIRLGSIEQVKSFVNIAMSKEFSVDLYSGKYIVNGKSIMGIFSIDLTKPIKMVADCDENDNFAKEIESFIFEEKI